VGKGILSSPIRRFLIDEFLAWLALNSIKLFFSLLFVVTVFFGTAFVPLLVDGAWMVAFCY